MMAGGIFLKREEKTKLTRERIITAAIEEFGTKGYAAASINNVCDKGIAKGLIYHNFENKDALYLKCLEICFHELTEALRETAEQGDFHVYITARAAFFKQNKNMAGMVVESLVHPPQKHMEVIAVMRKQYDEMNLRIFEKILDSNHLRDGIDSEGATNYFLMLQNMFNWYFTSPSLGGGGVDSVAQAHEDILPKMIDYMFYGILKEEDAP